MKLISISFIMLVAVFSRFTANPNPAPSDFFGFVFKSISKLGDIHHSRVFTRSR